MGAHCPTCGVERLPGAGGAPSRVALSAFGLRAATAPGALTRRRGINAIATGTQTIVIGGWIRRDRRLANYTAAGTAGVPLPTRAAPSYIVSTDDSLVHAGVLAAGSRSGSVVAMSGTSVAAPQYARALADYLGGVAPLPPATPIGGLPERIGNGLVDLPPVVGLRRYE
jgi:hypothetical protein